MRAVQAEQLQPSEAARIFEGQLASALVAEDGQLALSNLAVSAAHGFMPKIQTQGQLGQARWRLISAPSIPGLRLQQARCKRPISHIRQLIEVWHPHNCGLLGAGTGGGRMQFLDVSVLLSSCS